jgi:hypothetical protein
MIMSYATKHFDRFVKEYFNNNKITNIDNIVNKLKNRKLDPYDILNDYCFFYRIIIIYPV